ncbi:unnamed protein product [Paramecium primaurelia]|uniref:Uncharacterized protein n=1 Tax=Paramecium primaurelia TaxID=5886 RepID=A0A8S1M983_PARPR|nr:unnamed protein product [Paramecium primaurelia]
MWKNKVLHISNVINLISNFYLVFLLQMSLHYLNNYSKKFIYRTNIEAAKEVVKILLRLSIRLQ